MKNSSTKKALKSSGLALLVCIVMLIGTTFAWFTDSITNTGNIIQSGNLDITATVASVDKNATEKPFCIEGINNGDDFGFGEAADIEAMDSHGENINKIINETLWEPGKSNAKLLEVKNKGSLAAKVKLDFNIKDGGLQDALWFDFVKVENNEVTGTFTKRDMSTLKSFAGKIEIPLKAGEKVQFILVYGMKEEATNEYQNKRFEADVVIKATQLNSEEDGFGNPDYDKIDSWDGTTDISWYDEDETTYTLNSAEALAGFSQLVGQGNTFEDKTINLQANVDLSNGTWTPIETFSGVFNGNGKEIKGLEGKNGLYAVIENGTVKNLKITDAHIENKSATGILCNRVYGTTTFEDITVSGELKNSGYYTGGMVGAVTNWGAIDAVVKFKDCVSFVDVISTSHQAGGIAGCAYANTIFENCINYGNVSETAGYGAGGIAGFISGYEDSPVAPTFINCENKGNINGKNRAGGIAGALGIEGGMGYYNLTAKFIGCKNSGTVSGETTGEICDAKVNYNGKPTTNLTIIIE